jgi:hypothetical protein
MTSRLKKTCDNIYTTKSEFSDRYTKTGFSQIAAGYLAMAGAYILHVTGLRPFIVDLTIGKKRRPHFFAVVSTGCNLLARETRKGCPLLTVET